MAEQTAGKATEKGGIHMWELMHLIMRWIIGGTND
jgi:hypothetical protein